MKTNAKNVPRNINYIKINAIRNVRIKRLFTIKFVINVHQTVKIVQMNIFVTNVRITFYFYKMHVFNHVLNNFIKINKNVINVLKNLKFVQKILSYHAKKITYCSIIVVFKPAQKIIIQIIKLVNYVKKIAILVPMGILVKNVNKITNYSIISALKTAQIQLLNTI